MTGYVYRGDPWLEHANAAILDARPADDVPVGLPDTPETTAARRRVLEQAILSPCGTPAAYRRHLRNGEPPCEMCRLASQATWTASKRSRRRKARREEPA